MTKQEAFGAYEKTVIAHEATDDALCKAQLNAATAKDAKAAALFQLNKLIKGWM